ncbi:MAG: HepT-like ribonuclease domain-containing protein [Nitrospirota bacterium]
MFQGDKSKIIPHIDYLEKELQFLQGYKREIDWRTYQSVREKRLEIERWVECIINATLDISKMFLTISAEEVPETSREILYKMASFIYEEEDKSLTFSELAKIRNTLAHRYLDIRWEDIKRFLQMAPELYPPFLKHINQELG